MADRKGFRFLKTAVLLLALLFCFTERPVWAGHDQGLQKSQHPDHDISVAPEPSGLVLFAVGGAMVAFRCRRKKKG